MREEQRRVGGLTIQSVERALAILETLARASRPLSVIEIGDAVGVQRTTLYALINTLIQTGYVERREQDGRLMISGKMYELSSMYPSRLPIVRQSNQHIMELARRYDVAARLSTCDEGGHLMPVASSEPVLHVSNTTIQADEQLYLNATSTGKLLLAYLPREDAQRRLDECTMARFTAHTITDRERLMEEVRQVRAVGYAKDEQEYLDDTTCISFPVLNEHKRLLGMLSVSGECGHMRDNTDALVREGLQRSKLISMELAGGTPISPF